MGHRVSCPELVGRDEELALLGARFEALRDAGATTVLIGGDAGIGKTRLVDEFGAWARSRGAVVVRGVCVPVGDGGLPYAPVAGILRDLSRQAGAAAEAVLGPLASGLPAMAPGGSGGRQVYSAVPRLVDDMARTRLFESVLTALDRVAERGPVVAVFEDLQWVDSASADLLTFLTRNLVDPTVLLVGTYRSDELGRDHPLRTWWLELARHPRVTQVRLGGLDRAQTGELIRGILGREAEPSLVDAIWSRSQGNAFFAEELMASSDRASVPSGIEDVVMARVEGLSENSQEVLKVAAIAGAATDHELLSAIGLLAPDELERALTDAVEKQVLVVEPGDERYGFRHELLREAVEAALLPGERRRLHRRVAEAMAVDPTGEPAAAARRAADLAVHWWAAGAWAESRDASVAAAEAAIEVWAFPEALRHLERALSAMARLPADVAGGPAERLRLLEKASDVAYLAGAGQRSVDLARDAIELADPSADPSGVARLFALLGRNAWAVGDSEAAFEAYRRAVELVPSDPPTAVLARVLAEEARGLMLLSRFAEAERRSREAMAVAVAAGARAEEGHLAYTLGCCRASLGHHDEGVTLVREALAIAEELASAEDLNRAYMGLSCLLMDAGRLDEAAALVFESAARGEELWGVRLNGAAGNGVEALLRLGRTDEAEALLARTDARGIGSCTATPALLRASVATRCGRFDEADRMLRTADDLTDKLADVQGRGAFHLQAARLALVRGRPEQAREDLQQALALSADSDDESYRPEMCALALRGLADEADQARARGLRPDTDRSCLLADELVGEAERLAAAPVRRGGTCPPRVEAFAAMSRAERSRLDRSDPDLWREAAGRWDDAREPHPAAYCRWREAEAVLASRAGRRRAHDCLRWAWRVCVAQGAHPLREEIEHLARRARLELPDVDQPPEAPASTVGEDLGLTRREVEVLGYLAAGRKDGEIAEALFISKKTVSVHVSNLLRKLDVANRVEAGRIGQSRLLG